ncbi:hypothetical protein ACFV1L_23325 [Kitasatospora sp. NPDC059646]|uniref:hypothetical protein n=1 Tax=Kitasatospora sp. NPDC059646 TaxID=3346893 RepID=UPI00367FEE06
MVEPERRPGRELPELREGFGLRRQAFELVAAAAAAERPERVVELCAPRLARRAPGALVAPAAARQREQWRLPQEGEAGLRLLVDAPGGTPVDATVTMRVRLVPRGAPALPSPAPRAGGAQPT